MVSGCGTKIVKLLFFTINLLIFLAGLLVVGVGVWLRIDSNFQRKITELLTESGVDIPPPDSMYIAIYVCIALGAVMLLTGFFGCCGAWCENVCLLGLFFSVVLTLFCAQIALSAYVYFKQGDIKEDLSTWYKTEILPRTFGDDLNPDLKKQLDTLYSTYKCCGADGCSDYNNLTPPQNSPDSCNCAVDPQIVGCMTKLYEDVRANWTYALLAVGVALLVELIAMIFACCLCSGIRQGAYDYYY